MKITRASVESFTAQNGALSYLWDSTLPGFGVRASPAGVKAFVVRYRINGRQRIKTIGRTDLVDLSDARNSAQIALAGAIAGKDPFNQRAAILTVADLAGAFQEARKGELKAKTLQGYDSLWSAHIIPVLGRRGVSDLTEEDAAALRKRLAKKPTTFNRCAALIIAAIKWHGLPVETHAFRRTKRFKEAGRARILSEDEMARLHGAFAEYKEKRKAGWRYADLFALLLLTGLRRDEWRLGQWSWIDWERGLYVLPDNKTGGRTVYLPTLAIQILTQRRKEARGKTTGFIFPSPRKGQKKAISWTWRVWNDMRTDLKLGTFWIHDMRRTAGSMAHKGGLSQRQVADLLGHKRLETSSRYIHDDDKKNTAEAAAAAISSGWKKSGFEKQ